MIGDKINIEEKHLSTARAVLDKLNDRITIEETPLVIAIGGESGSGKSTLALAIQQSLQEEGTRSFIFQMDDYFKLPPKSNHENRLKNIVAVGPQEVLLDVLDEHLEIIKNRAAKILDKPLVDYENNLKKREQIDISNIDVIIVEGTYVLSLENVDVRIFLTKTYHETRAGRLMRARDEMTSFNEEVLEIEHQIIKAYRLRSDYIIDSGNVVRTPSDNN